MTILNLVSETAGSAGVVPRVGQMVCTDDLAAITTAGFINNSPASQGIQLSNGDFLAVRYGVVNAGGGVISGGTPALMTCNIPSTGVITLEVPSTDVPLYVQGITAGTSAANKALVLDNSNKIDGQFWSQIVAAGATNDTQWSNVTTVSTTPASGTCAVQFQFTAQNGNVAVVTPYNAYVSTSAGVLTTAVTGIATLTHGVLHQITTGLQVFGTSDVAGLVGMTVTASAGTYYITFQLPNGSFVTSSAIVVNA